jgi:hypothetical protein
VSWLSKIGDFIVSHPINSILHRLRSIVGKWYTEFVKIFTNRTLGYTGGFGNFILPHSRFIHSQKVGGLDPVISPDIRDPIVSTAINTVPFQTIDNSLGGTIMFVGDNRRRDAFIVHADYVTNVKRKSSKSSFIHVYNLETDGGWYFANNIISHNCRHSFSPFFEGLSERNYDKKTLDEYANKKVTYRGEEISWYDATQEQRKIERDIREAKRVAAAVEAAGLDAGDEKTVIRQLQAEMRDFVNQTGLNRQYPREQVDG